MTYLLLQTFLLLLASYFLGAFVACMVKRLFFGSQAEAPAHALAPAGGSISDRPPLVVPPQPVRPRPTQPAMSPVTPRAIDPVQPKIEVLRRPEPRPAPSVLDPSRFERALIGPDPNEGLPRIAIVEIRPSVLEPVTDIYRPQPTAPPPEPEAEELPPEIPVEEEALKMPEPEATPAPEPRAGGLAARLRDATTASAAGAVAAAKAAAAASVAISGFGSSRRARLEEHNEEMAPEALEEKVAEPVAEEPAEMPEEMSDTEQESSETFEEAVVETAAVVSDEGASAEHEPGLQEESEAAFMEEPEQEPESEPERMPEPEPEPAPVLEQAPVVQAEEAPTALIEGGDDFQRIRAIDDDIERKLKMRGVAYFEHIAAWSASDVRRIGQELEIPGRIDREQWIEQAQILAKGGETYYSRNRKAMLKARAEALAETESKSSTSETATSASKTESAGRTPPSQPAGDTGPQREGLSGVAAANQGRSVAEMAAAAAAAIAAASASVTRGLKPIEPISPMSKADPKISMPARITDAIREKGSAAVAATAENSTDDQQPTQQQVGPDEGPHDDLKRIRGVGVLIEKRLNAMGIRRYEQIANWTSGDIDRVSRMLEFKGRIERESWVEQARILASGGYTEFSRRVDKGEVDTSRET